jgi:uncharacterized damage-inducible protein DinB
VTNTDIGAALDALAAFPNGLQRRLQSLSDAELRFKPAPKEWSAVEVVGHLCDVEALWAGRIRQMLASEQPAFAPFDPDALVAQQRYQEKQVAALLSTLAERRAEHLEFLRGLRAPQLERGGLHPTRGPVTVGGAIVILSGHDQLHLNQIEANLKAFAERR